MTSDILTKIHLFRSSVSLSRSMIRACFDRKIHMGTLGQGLSRLYDPQVDQSDWETVLNNFDFDISKSKLLSTVSQSIFKPIACVIHKLKSN